MVDQGGKPCPKMVSFNTPWYKGTVSVYLCLSEWSLTWRFAIQPNSFKSFLDMAKHTGVMQESESRSDLSGYSVSTAEALETLSDDKLRELFQSNDIHIVPDSNRVAHYGFNHETCENLEIDVDAPRQFQGRYSLAPNVLQSLTCMQTENRYLSSKDKLQTGHMRVATLRELFAMEPSDARRVDVNCLDIPLRYKSEHTPKIVRLVTKNTWYRLILLLSHVQATEQYGGPFAHKHPCPG
jgi:hypothetical protein